MSYNSIGNLIDFEDGVEACAQGAQLEQSFSCCASSAVGGSVDRTQELHVKSLLTTVGRKMYE